ncbi:MAG: sigma-54-dependent Fis family transcriptional regulator [Myxococcales bacterium]|nr:sigma-54-dependent Fis family transcriptional regulator [Myxococcales bacterium]
MSAEQDIRVLVVDDDDGVRYTLTGVLEDKGLSVLEAGDGEQALALLERERDISLVISDLRMPKLDGMGLLAALEQRAREGGPAMPKLVMITAHGSERLAVEAMKAGAFDYFRKPFEIDELSLVIDRALAGVALESENLRLLGERDLAQGMGMIFDSPAMSRLAVLVHRVAPRDVTVLISGESGTGKERVAEAIVAASARREKPFVRFNCAALSPELAEAELFGHAKGSFTGAHRARSGLFREADGGTLLLDEIGELDLSVQAKLLRVLQSGEVRPVGEDHPIRVDVRLLAATHRDLPARVAEGSFREDLYYRLAVVQLRVPSLRERPEDIAPLARHFLRRYAERFAVPRLREPAQLLPRLAVLPWPGNVRQLKNTIERAAHLARNAVIEPADLHLGRREGRPVTKRQGEDEAVEGGEQITPGVLPEELYGLPFKEAKQHIVDEFERAYFSRLLAMTDNNLSRASAEAGITRYYLRELLKRLGMHKGSKKDED